MDDYLNQPIGKYVCGSTYAVWWRSVRLNGITFWGRPDEQDIHRLARALDAEGSHTAPHASLIDSSRLESVDLGAFNALAGYVRGRRAEYARLVTRQALLRPDGLTGAAVAGFYAVLTPHHPIDVFVELSYALAWLGVEDEAAATEDIETMHAEAVGASSLVVELRAHLEERLGAATLSDAAALLRLSPRNLQRGLRSARTTFQGEVNAAQVRVAKTLLLGTNYDLKRIAIEVGCSSLQHFSVLFRRLTGAPPSQWRADRAFEQAAPLAR